MFKLTFENDLGDTLVLTPDGDLSSPYSLNDIDGLNPPKATINTSQLALVDGAQFNSSKLNMRTINVAFTINSDAAENRVNVYKVLKTKHSVKIGYESDTRDVCIDGRVESIDVGYMASPQVVSAAVLCPYPYWRAAQDVVSELAQVHATFHFAFASTAEPQLVFGYIDPLASIAIANDGDVETGIVVELYARGTVENPRIVDYITNDYIQLNTTMREADLITIDTRMGHKTATLLRDGVTTSVFNTVASGSTWLQLAIGGSIYTYTASGGTETGLMVSIRHTDTYEGV